MISRKPGAQPYIGAVKVGPKGQIVIPKEVREMFEIAPGDLLVVLAHPQRGVALEKQSELFRAADAVLAGRGAEAFPGEKQEGLEVFAAAVKKFGRTGDAAHDGD